MALLTYYELEFHRADDPPEDNSFVICTDGIGKIGIGFYTKNADPSWAGMEFDSLKGFMSSAIDLPWVKAWAALPDWGECIADCYPDRACRVCGCTQDNGCEGGCSWIEWDICDMCQGKEEMSLKLAEGCLAIPEPGPGKACPSCGVRHAPGGCERESKSPVPPFRKGGKDKGRE
jgi:hypothetical protein